MGGHKKFESGAGLKRGSKQIGHFLYSSLKVEERQVKISHPTVNPWGWGATHGGGELMIVFPAIRNSRHLTPPLPHLPGKECISQCCLALDPFATHHPTQMQKGRASPSELQGAEHRAGLL